MLIHVVALLYCATMKKTLFALALFVIYSPSCALAQVWVNPEFGGAPESYPSLPALTERPVPSSETLGFDPIPKDLTDGEAPKHVEDSFETKWSGRVNFGASLQTGNTEKDGITADAEIKAELDDKQSVRLKAEINREKDEGTITEDNRSLDALYDHFFAPQWFFNATAGLEQDDIANLDLRTTLGAGLGYQPYKSDALNLQMVLGPTYLHEDFENGNTDDSITARWALEYNQKVLDERFDLFHDHEIFIPSDDTGAFLLESKTGVRVPITAGIIASGQIDFDWDNDPEPGIVEDDTKYALKLGYEW